MRSNRSLRGLTSDACLDRFELDPRREGHVPTRHRAARFMLLAAPALLLLGSVLAPVPASAQLTIPSQCQDDTGCASNKKENGFCPNDEAGQRDLTQFCVDPGEENSPYELHSKWNWDEVNGFAGGNTGDGCTLYDTDDDGNANYAVCVSITDGSPPGTCSDNGATCDADNDCNMGAKCILAEQLASDSPRLFLCDDEKPDRCTEPDLQINQCRDANGNTPSQPDTCRTDADCTNANFPTCGLGVCQDNLGERTNAPCVVDGDCGTGETCDTTTMGPYQTQCEVNISSDDPFDAASFPLKGPGDAYPKDTEALCWIDLQDFNGTDASLIDACSYPSREANSAPADCILFSACTIDADCNDSNECTNDTCDTTSGSCRFTPKAEGTACGDSSDTVCDNPDTCSAEGFCQDNNEPDVITACGDQGVECSVDDYCVAGACQDNGFESPGTACGDPSSGLCDAADTCDADGVCQPNTASDGTSCDDTLFCTVGDQCTAGLCGGDARDCSGSADECNDGVCNETSDQCEAQPKSAGTSCGDGSDTECTDPDTCDGAGTCLDNHAGTTTTCGDAEGECTNADFCDGVGGCTDNGFKPATTACGDPTDDECNNPDHCSGTDGSCVNEVEPTTTACGDAEGECTNADFCDGAGGCTDNGFKPATTPCSSDNNVCTDDICDGAGACAHPAAPPDEQPEQCQAGCDPNEENCTLCLPSACPHDAECQEGVCQQDQSCGSPSNLPSGTACGDDTDTECDNPDTCLDGACQDNFEPGGDTVTCGDAGTECVNQDYCDGVGGCTDNGYPDAGTFCGDDTTSACTEPDTCDGAGVCLSNNLSCASVTDSALCVFDVAPDKGVCVGGAYDGSACSLSDQCGDTSAPDCVTRTECAAEGGSSCEQEEQFRLVFTPAPTDGTWPSYKLTASNPGQTFYNLISDDPGCTPGVTTETFEITIPYPYVTVGAMPVHVYDGDVANAPDDDCFMPDEALDSFDTQISLEDWIMGGPNSDGVICDAVCGPDGVGFCTFVVEATYPDSCQLYVNVHLDYGLKGPHLDANPCDDGVTDRYEAAAGSSPWMSSDALVNDSDPSVVAITDCQDLEFSHTDGTDAFSDIVQNLNQYKGLAGGFGRGHKSENGDGVEGAIVTLTLLSTNEVVAQGTTDEDGYYLLPYQHKGKRALYLITLWGAGAPMDQLIELQANGWAEVNFDVSTGAIDASWKGQDTGPKKRRK